LMINGHKSKRYNLGHNQILNKMVPNVYVLGARVQNQILGTIDSTCIVAMNSHGTLRKVIVK